ncbi:MAG: 3-hydroxyacyl-ACP dehydratase FabZ [Gammaproteobacteria bacterium]|nr:3-hydroxyacyl-ACP dehydratase FabZ [Gammaproteobacteria bacterium]NNC69063.1 3-hydroxyacyl-ACP dehydratase FabZ [Gammaproteobacteria bacterium]
MAEMSIHDILKYLPHRYPFLLVDRVLKCEIGKSVLAIKNVSFNEPFFQGHFPSAPVMPGVLILEALAQASGLLALSNPEWRPDDESLYLFVGIDKARFKRQVGPGDQLILDVRLKRHKRGYGVFEAVASVEDEVAASAELMCVFKEVETS